MTTVGRKAIRGNPLTSAQKKQRQRMKMAIRIEEAKNSGYTPMLTLINKKQLMACAEYEKQFGNNLTDGKLAELIFQALNNFLKSNHMTDLPEHSGELSIIDIKAKIKFQEWEAQQ
jgi:hypothetical protein